jgi:hypothetical protein
MSCRRRPPFSRRFIFATLIRHISPPPDISPPPFSDAMLRYAIDAASPPAAAVTLPRRIFAFAAERCAAFSPPFSSFRCHAGAAARRRATPAIAATPIFLRLHRHAADITPPPPLPRYFAFEMIAG